MKEELLEKLGAIRKDLMVSCALAAESDPKRLVDFVKQKFYTMWSNYEALQPHMNHDQKTRAIWAFALAGLADRYLQTGKDSVTPLVRRDVPLMLADLDAIEREIQKSDEQRTS